LQITQEYAILFNRYSAVFTSYRHKTCLAAFNMDETQTARHLLEFFAWKNLP
jgi:hypothetical protein